MDPKSHLDTLQLPKDAKEFPLGIGIVGKVLSRNDGTVSLRVLDAILRFSEESILSIDEVPSTQASADPAFVRFLLKPSTTIERTQTINLTPKSDECDCAQPFLLDLAGDRPVTQNLSEISDVSERRARWARERGLNSSSPAESQCTYSTHYSTMTWNSDTQQDSQTDRYHCD